MKIVEKKIKEINEKHPEEYWMSNGKMMIVE